MAPAAENICGSPQSGARLLVYSISQCGRRWTRDLARQQERR